MQLTLWIMCHVLFITHLFHTSEGTESGCADWSLSKNEICCSKCHPGNRLVERCGEKSHLLCVPCEPGYYVTSPTPFSCNRCTQCRGKRFAVKNCTSSSDTVCGCVAGLRCGNPQCSYCVDECRQGEEPTENRTCRKCPKGTFNDKIHSNCINKTNRCPKGKQLVPSADASSDNECSPGPSTSAQTPKTPKVAEYNTVEPLETKSTKKDDSFLAVVALTGGVSALTIVFILGLWFAYQRTKTKKSQNETKDPLPETLPPEELRVMIVEQDDACSFRQPEQEQGGSSESISTQDSETKLIV